jgi:hypothetical protein
MLNPVQWNKKTKILFGGMLLAIVAAGLFLIAGPSANSEAASLAEELDSVEEGVQEQLHRLGWMAPSNASAELKHFERWIRKARARCSVLPMPADTKLGVRRRVARTVEELERLDSLVEQWNGQWAAVSDEERAETLTRIQVAGVSERTRWPLAGVYRDYAGPLKMPPFRVVGRGIVVGIFWPVIGLRNAVFDRSTSGPLLQRLLIPIRDQDFQSAPLLFGMVCSVMGAGYAFCWLGMRSNQAWASYAGPIYFLYLIFFAVLVLLIRLGTLL